MNGHELKKTERALQGAAEAVLRDRADVLRASGWSGWRLYLETTRREPRSTELTVTFDGPHGYCEQLFTYQLVDAGQIVAEEAGLRARVLADAESLLACEAATA